MNAGKTERGGLVRDTVWNALVNGAVAGLSFLVLALAARLAGEYWCGVVALALAVSQQLFTLGNFTMQDYQASDVNESRSFSDYVSAKLLSLSLMLSAAVAWVFLGNFSRDKMLALAALTLFQASDAFGMVFFARYWQRGHLSTACRVRFLKIVAFAGVYAVTLALWRLPLVALAAGACAHAALFFALDAPLLKRFGPLDFRLPGRAALGILWACAPLAANSFLVMFVNNGPRFAVDAVLGEGELAAFSALFMVSFAVSVCGDFLMNPQVVRLAKAVAAGDHPAACRIVGRQALLVAGLGVLALAVGATLGIPVLSWLFGLDLSGRRGVLLLLLGGGILVAYYQLAQTVLIVLRRQAWGTPGMLVASLGVLLAARPLVAAMGLKGAAWSYCAAVAVLVLCSGGFAVRHFRAAFAGLVGGGEA